MTKDYSEDSELYLKVFNATITKTPLDVEFRRLGAVYDGGYVCVNDFSKNDYLLSFGIAEDVSFEKDLENIVFGTDLYDYSIDDLPEEIVNSRFFKEKIGKDNFNVFDRLPIDKDVVLKIDIEGSEWDFFSSLSDEQINRFRQIVVEFHWGIDEEHISCPEIPIEIIEKINRTHQLVLVHPNNYSQTINIGGKEIPQVLEMTFLRKSSYSFSNTRSNVGHLLSANNPESQDLYFINNQKVINVYDNFIGNLIFPEYDKTIATSISENGIWEEEEFKLIQNSIKEGDVCINVGANVGYFTLLMSKIVGENGKVFSIEANPDLEIYLRENCHRSEYDNIDIIMSAAGDTTGTTELFISSDNCGDNRVYNPSEISNLPHDNFNIKSNPVTVKIDRVDNLVKTDRLDFVLIDCQGWDYKVIRGMSDLIKTYKPQILFEFVPSWISKLSESPLLILKEFQDMGYDILCPELGINEPNRLEDIANIFSDNSLVFTNVYMRPKTI